MLTSRIRSQRFLHLLELIGNVSARHTQATCTEHTQGLIVHFLEALEKELEGEWQAFWGCWENIPKSTRSPDTSVSRSLECTQTHLQKGALFCQTVFTRSGSFKGDSPPYLQVWSHDRMGGKGSWRRFNSSRTFLLTTATPFSCFSFFFSARLPPKTKVV